MSGEEQSGGWTERVVRLAAALGANPVRVRWKLQSLQERLRAGRRRVGSRKEQLEYRHQICPHCGSLQDGAATVCLRCNQSLSSRPVRVVQQVGGLLGLTPTRLLMLLCVLGYAWVLATGESSSFFNLSGRDLVRWGGNAAWLTLDGGWWRLATYMLLHGGIWHIGFNLYALHIIGPLTEQIYGPRRLLLLFWVTGVLAGITSLGVGILASLTGGGVLGWVFPQGVSISASGSIMGLTGVMAAWGHRSRTTVGLQIRNVMLRWALYTLIFGLLIRADNGAHFGGFVAGGLLGLLLDPQRFPARSPLARRLWDHAGPLGLALVLATALAIPATPWLTSVGGATAWLREVQVGRARVAERVVPACTLLEEGKLDQSLAVFARTIGVEARTPEQQVALVGELVEACDAFRQRRAESGPASAPVGAASAQAP